MSDNEEILYTETKNYKFRKDSPENYYDIGVVNDNLDKIDKTIKDVKDENTNVQSDWNVTATNSDAFIKNKPTSLPANGGNADTVDGKHATDFIQKYGVILNKNADDIKTSGEYYFQDGINVPDSPVGHYGWLKVETGYNDRYLKQLYTPINGTSYVYQRFLKNNVWDSWTKIGDNCNALTLNNHEDSYFATAAQMTTANNTLNNKVDKVSGKDLSTNDFTAAYKAKLDGIANGADANVQSDWNVTATNSDAYIKNKPASLPADGGNADTVDGKHASDFATASQITDINTNLNNKVDKVSGKDLSTNDFTAAYKTKLDGIANGADANVQSDWNVTATNSDAYIKNKPASLPADGGIADTIKNTLPIDKGGTGATDVVEVLKNLRLAHKNISEVPESALLTYSPASIILPIFGAKRVTMLEFTNALPNDINIMCKHFGGYVYGISDLPTFQGDLLIMKSYPAPAMKKVFAIFFDNENGGGLYYWMSVNEKVVINWYKLVNENQIKDFVATSQITDINNTLNDKVDKVSGKDLSTNDFTAAYKTKLDGIAKGADANVQSDWNEKNTGSDAFIQNKPTSLPANGGNADTVDGKHAVDLQNYNNLTNKPTSLPADGGNADTIDGKHAADFAPSGYGLGDACKLVFGNWNDYITTGFYSGNNLLNQPTPISEHNSYYYVIVIRYDSLWCMQIAFLFNDSSSMYTRSKTGNGWTAWNEFRSNSAKMILENKQEIEDLTVAMADLLGGNF